jgi:hypothetical protein
MQNLEKLPSSKLDFGKRKNNLVKKPMFSYAYGVLLSFELHIYRQNPCIIDESLSFSKYSLILKSKNPTYSSAYGVPLSCELYNVKIHA